MGVARAAVGRLPALSEFLHILDGVRVRQHTGGRSAVGEILRAELLDGDPEAQRVLLQSDGE